MRASNRHPKVHTELGTAPRATQANIIDIERASSTLCTAPPNSLSRAGDIPVIRIRTGSRAIEAVQHSQAYLTQRASNKEAAGQAKEQC